MTKYISWLSTANYCLGLFFGSLALPIWGYSKLLYFTVFFPMTISLFIIINLKVKQ